MLEALGNIGDFAGGIGVLVTLLYLAVQIRQHTRMNQAAALQAALTDVATTMEGIVADAELSRILLDGHDQFESFDRERRRRYAMVISIILRRYENLLFQTRYGNLDPSVWSGLDAELRHIFSKPGANAWWQKGRVAFNRDLQDHIDRLRKDS